MKKIINKLYCFFECHQWKLVNQFTFKSIDSDLTKTEKYYICEHCNSRYKTEIINQDVINDNKRIVIPNVSIDETEKLNEGLE